MTYLQFLGVFILPPIVALMLMRPWRGGLGIKKIFVGLSLMSIIAIVYTTPWDNYLVYRGIWSYGADRVLFTIGYVPVEEYLFFVLQTFLTGLLFFYKSRSMRFQKSKPAWSLVILFLVITLAGVIFLFNLPTLYLGLILAWGAPILALQALVGGSNFLKNMNLYAATIAIPTVYLWICDSIAIHLKIWEISEVHTIGLKLFTLPIEEAVFFLVTNMLVVQGLWLFSDEDVSNSNINKTTSQYIGFQRKKMSHDTSNDHDLFHRLTFPPGVPHKEVL